MTLRTCSIIVGRPYAASPITLYSSSLTLKPRYAVKVEYSIPSECGNRISRRSVISVASVRLAVALPCGQRGPFADAVGGQDRRASCRRGEERGGRMRDVMIGKQNLLSRHAEVRRDDAAHPDLFSERVLHGVRKRAPRSRERAQRADVRIRSNFSMRPLVEHDRVEIGRLETCVFQAPVDGTERECRRRSCGATAVPLEPRRPARRRRRARRPNRDSGRKYRGFSSQY